MEVRLVTFPLYVSMGNNFPFQSFCTLHITRRVRNITGENLDHLPLGKFKKKSKITNIPLAPLLARGFA
jgi:hypothetical protein